MHNIGPDIDEHEVGTFSIRSSVEAIACPEGAVITDKDGNQLASYPDKCHVVIDGDERFIVADYVFAGLFTETDAAEQSVTTSADVAAQHEATATLSGQPVAPSHDDLVDGLRELDPEKLAAIRAALDEVDPVEPAAADTTTTSSASSTTPVFTGADGGTETPTSAAPSDAGLSGDGSASSGHDAATTGGQ